MQSLPERSVRFAEVDCIKACGILIVVLIHTARSPFEPNASPVELWLGQVTRFAVPGFLAVSGFLYATNERIAWSATRTRLLRIAVPYLLFSIVGQIVLHMQGRGTASGNLATDLLFGATYGPYYYVFVAALLAAMTPLFARVSGQARWGLFVALLASQAAFETHLEIPFFWHLRNPLLWAGYFYAGWLARLHHEAITRFIARHSMIVLLSFAIAVIVGSTALATGLPLLARRSVEWAIIYPILGLLFTVGSGRSSLGALDWVVLPLSRATYSIYLIHLFFLYPLRARFQPPPGSFDALALAAPWALSLLASGVVILVGRRLLGARSRTWIGS